MKTDFKKELVRIMKEESDYLIPSDSQLYQKVISELLKPFKGIKIDKVVAIDMKGLMYGPIIAYKLKCSFVPLLKGNKIKRREKMVKKEFHDYSENEKSIELFKSSIKKNEKILLIDDWFDSGNTGKAAISLIESLGGKIAGISVIFDRMSDENKKFFRKYNYHYLVKLEG